MKISSHQSSQASRLLLCHVFKMALFQYPCPEEIDVFSGPHMRMRQLVYEAFEKLSTTNFKDDVSLVGFLGCIDTIFQELKHHEEIENMCIMTELQHRLLNEQILAIVNDVHKDNHVLEILSLTRKGLKRASKDRTILNRSTFEDKLKTALASFQKDFVPHMRHEEEVFQPLLMEYFTFEELKGIKARVVHLHSVFSNHEGEEHTTVFSSHEGKRHCDSLSDYRTLDDDTCEKSSTARTNVNGMDHNKHHAETLKPASSGADSVVTSDSVCNSVVQKTFNTEIDGVLAKDQPLLLNFPSEISLKIFSYLGPKDLCHCSQVCQAWSQLAKDGSLWREVYPVRWIFGNDWRFGADSEEACTCNCDAEIQNILNGISSSSLADAGTDVNVTGDGDPVTGTDSSGETPTEMRQLLGMVRYLFPAVGLSVWVLKLGCCPMLSNGLAFKILSHCPNLRQLDLSQTAVSDLGLKGLFRKASRLQLQHLDVSGCRNITDKTLFKLSSSLGKLPAGSGISDIEDSGCDCHKLCSCGRLMSTTPETFKRGLVYLGLSGCYQITDTGLRALAKYGGLPKLCHLDLSGCLQVTAEGLLDLVLVCPNLDHTQFFYCDNIDEGPYPDTASGCQNLQCKNRVCCRTGE